MSPSEIPPSSPLHGARPLFVLGAPRSGTTFLAKLLDAHPAVLMTNEVRVFTFFQHAIRDLPRGDEGGLHCSRSFGDEFAGALEEHATAIIRRTYERIAATRGDRDLRYFGDKNPHHATCLDLVARCFPDATYVRIRRDPRDIVCSILEMHNSSLANSISKRFSPLRLFDRFQRRRFRIGSGAESARKVAATARAVAGSIGKSVEFLGQLPRERVLELGYEDLVSAPDEQLEGIFVDFLGLPDARAPRTWLRDNRSRDSHGWTGGKIDFARRSIARWRRELEASEVAAAERELRGVLAIEGYA